MVKTPSGEYLQDTARIIDYFEAQTRANTQSNIQPSADSNSLSVVPDTPAQQLVSELFALWGDEWLVIPAMHYRWNKDNFPFIYEEFGQVVIPKAPKFIKRILEKNWPKNSKDLCHC